MRHVQITLGYQPGSATPPPRPRQGWRGWLASWRLGARQRRVLAARLAAARVAAAPTKAGPTAPRWQRPHGLARLLGLTPGRAVDDQLALVPALLAAAAAMAITWLALAVLLGAGGLVAAPLGLCAGVAGGRLWTGWRLRLGRERLEAQLVDALAVIMRCVRAGVAVPAALQVVASDVPAPLGPEFDRAARQLQLGVAFEAALDTLAARCALADVRVFAVALGLQRQTGGNLVHVLDTLSDTIRSRRAVRLKAVALTSEARATVLVLAVLPLAVMALLSLTAPDYVARLTGSEEGRMLLGLAILAQGLGLLVIQLITRRALP